MTTRKRPATRRTPASPPAVATGIPKDTMMIMSRDGGDNFHAAIVDGCTVSRYAWPTILRTIADKLEAELRA